MSSLSKKTSTARENGFVLEECLSKLFSSLKLSFLREREINSKYGRDYNGVDFWFSTMNIAKSTSSSAN